MVETFDPDVLVEPERAERRRAAGCEVLVVEDDPDLRETLVSILDQEGYRARAACRGELEAVHVAHGLRGAAGERDAECARALAGRLGVPFTRLDVAVSRGSGLEAEARRARYAALLGLLREREAGTLVATGH